MNKFVFLSACAIAASSSTSIEGQVVLPAKLGIPEWIDLAKFFSDARVVLVSQGKEVARTSPNQKGVFKLNNVIPGSYITYFPHPFLRIDPVFIDITGDRLKVSTYEPLKEGTGNPIALPLTITPSAFLSPYTAEEEFNALQIFKNPMVIMGLVLVGLVWLMPKIQGGVSPEDMREMRKGLAEEGGFAASILKNMIPADPSDSSAGKIDNIPSLVTPPVVKKNQ